MKAKSLYRITLSLLLVFWFSSAWAANTIKWSMKGDSLTLDPHAQNEGPTSMVARQVYEALVTRGIDMSIGPQLATDWKATNPTTWVFNLRKDVTFHNGDKMTAEDVVFSLLELNNQRPTLKNILVLLQQLKHLMITLLKFKQENQIQFF